MAEAVAVLQAHQTKDESDLKENVEPASETVEAPKTGTEAAKEPIPA